MDNPTNPKQQSKPDFKDHLHGVTLEMILKELVAHYGWERLGEEITINCFLIDPSIKSSLTFLRRTPWARQKVEKLYIYYKEYDSEPAPDHSAK